MQKKPGRKSLRDEILDLKKKSGGYKPDFDLDLAIGLQGEALVTSLFSTGIKVEVKRDLKASETGNLAIEVMYRGKPSGISTTKADYWAFVLNNSVIFVPTKIVMELAEEGKEIKGGDNKWSTLRLVSISKLLKRMLDTQRN